MKIGISTACLYPMETCRALETLLQAGFRQFEIFFQYLPGIPARLCGAAAGIPRPVWREGSVGTSVYVQL